MTETTEPVPVPVIEKQRFIVGDAVHYPYDYHRIACQVWTDHGDVETEPAIEGDWLMGARDGAGVLVGYVRYAQTERPHEMYLAELVVDDGQRGRGVGESLLIAMAKHLLSDLPQRTRISMQPIEGDERARERRRWFNEFGFWMSAAADDTNGVWFAPTDRVVQGRSSAASGHGTR